MILYRVTEIFESIQGEGVNMGRRVSFIRLAGCNLTCPWCDTDHEGNFENMTADQIIDSVDSKLVVITGGEPTIQPIAALTHGLVKYGHEVAIETNGTQSLNNSYLYTCITCSPKEQSNFMINSVLKPTELKYVVDEKFDAAYAIPETVRHIYSGRIWLQGESMRPEMYKKAYDIAMQDNRLRVGVQLHKILGVD